MDQSVNDNSAALDKTKKALRLIMEKELTDTQRRYVELYFFEGYKMKGVAEKCGVDISTVSRTIKRATHRMKSALKYVYLGAMDDDD